MKFKLAVTASTNNQTKTEDGVVLFVSINEGTFIVNYNCAKVDFFPKMDLELVIRALAGNTTVRTIVEYQFGPEDLKPKEGFPGTKHYQGATLQFYIGEHWRRLVVEYLDGNIPMHKHNKGEREVYVSTDAPFEGRVCNFGEAHETFSNHTIAVKLKD